MYHIWKISKIISSETRGNLTGRNETQSSEAHHNISTPPDSPPPPPPTPTPFYHPSANKLSRPELVRKRPQLVQS